MPDQLRNPIVLVLLVLTVLCGGAAAFYYMDNSSLRSHISELEADNGNAQAAIKQLEAEKSALIAQKSRNTQIVDAPVNKDELSKENERLRADLAAMKNEINALKDENGRFANREDRDNRDRGGWGRDNNRRGENMQDRMERLREEDPERYEQIMTERENFQKQMQDRQNKVIDYFSKVNTSKMTREQRDSVKRYNELLQQQQELQASGDFRAMMENGRELMQLNSQVRDALLDQYSGNAAAEAVKEIYDMTNMFGGPGGGFRGGPRRGGGGPPR